MSSAISFPGVPQSATSPLILKGQAVRSIEEVPFIAQIKNNIFDEIVCGGTILNTLLVLTAAHCVYDPKRKRDYPLDSFNITAGELRRDAGSSSQSRQVVRVIKTTPPYNPDTHADDIVILVLNSPLIFSRRVNSVHLTNAPTTTGFARVYGWGYTENQGIPNSLLKTAVRLMSEQKCRESYPLHAEFFPQKMICARGENKMVSCKGDSGSPLFCVNHPFRLCGITSFGEDGECSRTTKPVVYVNVINYVNWIRNAITLNPERPSIATGKTASVCTSKQFQCKNQKCIPSPYKCDLDNDCGDWSDETDTDCSKDKAITHAPGDFLQQPSGQIIVTQRPPTVQPQTPTPRPPENGIQWPGFWNRVTQPTQGPPVFPRVSSSQSQTHFSCNYEKTIPGNQKCDGIVDCVNGGDELGCSGCQSNEISCSNKCYKVADFCYFQYGDTDYQYGRFFGTCTRTLREWGSSYSKVTTRKCDRQHFCDAGFRCIRCSIEVKCHGSCRSSTEVCNIKKRLRG